MAVRERLEPAQMDWLPDGETVGVWKGDGVRLVEAVAEQPEALVTTRV